VVNFGNYLHDYYVSLKIQGKMIVEKKLCFMLCQECLWVHQFCRRKILFTYSISPGLEKILVQEFEYFQRNDLSAKNKVSFSVCAIVSLSKTDFTDIITLASVCHHYTSKKDI